MAERETTDYMERLDRYEALERERLETSGVIQPRRAGRVNMSHQSVDAAHGIVVDVAVTPGNVNDSGPYLKRIEYMREHLGLDIREAGANSANGTSMIYRAMEDMGIQLHTPGATGVATYKVEFRREDFRYEQEKDCFVCPAGKELTLRSLERENYNVCRVYRAEKKDC